MKDTIFEKKIFKCFYCGLKDKRVECSGIWYCPNPHCPGPGGHWFRATLNSYTVNNDGTHSVCEEELEEKANQWENGKWKKKEKDSEVKQMEKDFDYCLKSYYGRGLFHGSAIVFLAGSLAYVIYLWATL